MEPAASHWQTRAWETREAQLLDLSHQVSLISPHPALAPASPDLCPHVILSFSSILSWPLILLSPFLQPCVPTCSSNQLPSYTALPRRCCHLWGASRCPCLNSDHFYCSGFHQGLLDSILSPWPPPHSLFHTTGIIFKYKPVHVIPTQIPFQPPMSLEHCRVLPIVYVGTHWGPQSLGIPLGHEDIEQTISGKVQLHTDAATDAWTS